MDDASGLPISSEHAPQPARKTSIAVLPFNNMSSDPEQEYFAEGLSEDLITDLSKVPGLLVIARNSSFAYKGKPFDIRQVARELGVRYVVEGSVRRAASRVRINAQIIDSVDHSHLWADRFDRDLADIFQLQDEIVSTIVAALAGSLPFAPPIAGRRATNIEAYDLFARGRVLTMQSPESDRAAKAALEKSIELDPGFSEAHAWLAMSHVFSWTFWGETIEPHRSLARALAKRAVALDPQNSGAHWILGYVRAYNGELSKGIEEFEIALRINPNHADAWALLGDLKVFEGHAAEALGCMRTAFRLNPYPSGFYYQVLGWTQCAAGQYEDAVSSLRHEATRGTGSRRNLAACLSLLGRDEEAHREAPAFMEMAPDFTVGQWARSRPFKNDQDR
jgi:TolB-like protein/Tfp pilus assembly protein PilF